MSGQRWNNFCNSYRDISFVVAENSRVVKPKCRQFTSLNKILNNFSKVLIVDISYTALINNEGISGIQEAPKIIEFTFSNLLRDVRDEKKSLMISGCQKCQSNLALTWFSHSTLPIPEDFAMDEDQKPTRDLERDKRFRDRLFERTAPPQWLFCWRRLLFFFSTYL